MSRGVIIGAQLILAGTLATALCAGSGMALAHDASELRKKYPHPVDRRFKEIDDMLKTHQTLVKELRRLFKRQQPRVQACGTSIAINDDRKELTYEDFSFVATGGGYTVSRIGYLPRFAPKRENSEWRVTAPAEAYPPPPPPPVPPGQAKALTERSSVPLEFDNEEDPADTRTLRSRDDPSPPREPSESPNTDDDQKIVDPNDPDEAPADPDEIVNPNDPDEQVDPGTIEEIANPNDPDARLPTRRSATKTEEKKPANPFAFSKDGLLRSFFAERYQSAGALLYKAVPGAPFGLLCSGALIDRHFFLTAAHCLKNTLAADHYQVYLPYGGLRAVAHIDLLPNLYNLSESSFNGAAADIAIVTLKEPIEGIRHPERLQPRALLPNGLPARILGYGITGTGKGDSGLLRSGDACIQQCIDSVDERASRPAPWMDQNSFVCWDHDRNKRGEKRTSNTCSGDSGGPMFVDVHDEKGMPTDEVLLASIASAGVREDCALGDHSFNTSVSAHEDWIQMVMNERMKAPGRDPPNLEGGLIKGSTFPIQGRFDETSTQFTYVFDAKLHPTASHMRLAFNLADASNVNYRFKVLAGNRRNPKSRHTLYKAPENAPFAFFELELDQPEAKICHLGWKPGEQCLVTVLIERVEGTGDFQILASWWDLITKE